MKKNLLLSGISLLAACLLTTSARGQTLFSFPLNEGGTNVYFTDTAQGLTGQLGNIVIDPDNDLVGLSSDSPSGLPGDGSFTNSGNGFLLAIDTNRVLNITNGPITMEAWVNKNGDFPHVTEGVMSYGGSYKLGFKGSGVMVFTLLGKVDITNSFSGRFPFDEWVHIATVWQPGVGVTFYIGSNSLFGATSAFVANTNLTAAAISHNLLSLGNEGFSNPLIAKFDRMRIHNEALTAEQLDEDPVNPKPNYPSTIVSYDFNESSFPCFNSVNPPMPATSGAPQIPFAVGPVWTNGVTGAPNDFGFYFDGTRRAVASDTNHVITLGPDTSGTNSDYTLQAWVKLPLGFEPTARMIMFQYDGDPAFSFSINTGRTLHTTTLTLNDINSTAVVPNDGQWHHVAAVHQNGEQMLFYIDGKLLSGILYNRGVKVASGPTYRIVIGGAGTTANPFTGTLDRISFTKGALKPEQFDIPGFVPAPPPSGDITSGLVLNLKMDETNGLTAMDTTSGHHDAALINFAGDNSQWVPGRALGGLRFTTTTPATNSTRAIINDSSKALSFTTNALSTNSAFSVASWIYCNSNQTAGAGILARGIGGNSEQYALDVQANGNLRFFVRDLSSNAVTLNSLGNGNTIRATNMWIHVVGVCNGANPTNGIKIYLNGLPSTVGTAPRAVVDNAHDVSVGAREGNATSGYSLAFNGIIDDVRVYNRALSDNDVATLYRDADRVHLAILASGNNALLSWESWATNYVPQSAGALLSTNTVWTDVSGSPTVNGYFNTLSVPRDPQNKFFRMRSTP